MRGFITLLGRKAEPPHRLRVVLRHTLAAGVHESEPHLRAGVALLSSQVQPPCGLGVVFGDTEDDAEASGVFDVHLPESELRDNVALLRVHSEHLDRSAVEM